VYAFFLSSLFLLSAPFHPFFLFQNKKEKTNVFDKRKTEIFPFEIPNSSKRSERNESFDLQELMKIQVSQGFPRSTRGFISLPLLFLLRKQKKKRIEISSPSKCVYRQQDSLPRRIGLDPRQLKFVNSFAFAASATKEKKERPIEVETYRSAQSTHTGPRGKTKSYVYIYIRKVSFSNIYIYTILSKNSRSKCTGIVHFYTFTRSSNHTKLLSR